LGWGVPPQKMGERNMQNFGRFHATFDFDREYLRNGSRYRKSEKNGSTTTPFTLGEKMVNFVPQTKKSSSGAYWPTQVDSFRESIFRPLEAATLSNFYTC